jgi:predicted RNA-binding Zn-ribbon protein involved in translation (DUF1610 family)
MTGQITDTRCPSCGFAFDSRRAADPEGLRGKLLYGPERLIVNARLDASGFDQCPSCGNRFVSEDFRFFGEFVRARLRSMGGVYALVFVLIAAFAAAFWLGQK